MAWVGVELFEKGENVSAVERAIKRRATSATRGIKCSEVFPTREPLIKSFSVTPAKLVPAGGKRGAGVQSNGAKLDSRSHGND